MDADFQAQLKTRASQAARTGNARLVESCFSQGLELPVPNDPNPSLIYAANDGASQGVYDVLLAHGWDVNQHLELEGSALTNACFHANTPLVKYLLSKGADPNRHEDRLDEYNALSWAIMTEQPHALETLKVLLTHGPIKARTAGTGAVLAAVEKGSLEALRLVVEEGDGGINEVVNYGLEERDDLCTPLSAAVADGKVEMTEYLMENGADPNWQGAGGKTARDVAVEDGSDAIVALLSG